MLNISLDLLTQVGDITKRAGQEIMKIYETDFQVEELSLIHISEPTRPY